MPEFHDFIISALLSKSSLTATQFEAFVLSRVEGNLSTKIAMRRGKKITKGSFLRTLHQAKSNIEASLYTLFLLSYVGAIPPGKLGQLAKISELTSKVKESNPAKEDAERLLTALEDLLVGLSGNG